jgi:2'-5' RNA ligase
LARRRVGVALVLDPPVADEVDGLRRALGEPDLVRIAPHVTLVRPQNLRAGDLPAALGLLRAAAAGSAPMRLTVGPVATFVPDNPVLYLEVGGDLPTLNGLRDAMASPPLERRSPWPYVPHVTLVDGLDLERIVAAVGVLDRYAAVADIDRVVLLEERTVGHGAGATRRWVPLADAALGRPAVIGRGGLELTITQGRVVGPDLRTLADDAELPAALDPAAARGGPWAAPIVLTAERSGACVGGAAAWWSAGRARAAVLVAEDVRGQGIGSHLLARLEAAMVDSGWEPDAVHGAGPPEWYAGRSRWIQG